MTQRGRAAGIDAGGMQVKSTSSLGDEVPHLSSSLTVPAGLTPASVPATNNQQVDAVVVHSSVVLQCG